MTGDDPRTPEQRAADDNLTEAIDRVLRAYSEPGMEYDSYVPGEYVVVASATRGFSDPFTIVPTVYKDGNVPLIGLLTYALRRAERYAIIDIQDDE